REDVGDFPIIGLRPKMRITAGVDQLDINAQTIARTLHAPLQQVSNAELLADLARVPRLARVVGAGGIAADDFKVSNPRQIGENFILHAGREVAVLPRRWDSPPFA